MSQHASDPSDADDSDGMPDEMEYTIVDSQQIRESNDKVDQLLPSNAENHEDMIPTRVKSNPLIYTTTSQSLDSPGRMNTKNSKQQQQQIQASNTNARQPASQPSGNNAILVDHSAAYPSMSNIDGAHIPNYRQYSQKSQPSQRPVQNPPDIQQQVPQTQIAPEDMHKTIQVAHSTIPEHPQENDISRSGMKSQGGHSMGRTIQSGYTVGRLTKEGENLRQFDKLDARDKFVLRKTQVILGQSKMYEMENRNLSQRIDIALARQQEIAKSLTSMNKTINVNAGMAERIQLAQQVVLEKNDRDKSKLTAMIEEIDMIKENFNERKRSISRQSRDHKSAMERQVLENLRRKQDEEFKRQQRIFGGVGSDNIGPVFSGRSSVRSGKKYSSRPKSTGAYRPARDRKTQQFDSFDNRMISPTSPPTDLEHDSPIVRNINTTVKPTHNFNNLSSEAKPFVNELSNFEEMNNLRKNTFNKRAKSQAGFKTIDLNATKQGPSQSINQSPVRRKNNNNSGVASPKKTGGKQKQKFNLNPDYQHVKATYMNTDKKVEEMRRLKDERIAELQRKKKILNEGRLPQIGLRKKKKANKKANMQTVDSSNLKVCDEMQPMQMQEPYQVNLVDPKVLKKRENEMKADDAMNRLMQDSEVRRKSKQITMAQNPNSYQEPLKYDENLRTVSNNKPSLTNLQPSERSMSSYQGQQKLFKGSVHSQQNSSQKSQRQFENNNHMTPQATSLKLPIDDYQQEQRDIEQADIRIAERNQQAQNDRVLQFLEESLKKLEREHDLQQNQGTP